MNSKSKRTILVLSFILFNVITTQAQDSLQVATSAQKADVIASRMERELSLTKAQAQQVNTIALERFELLKQSNTNRTTPLTTANDQAQKKLTTVFTKEQMTLYLQLRSDTKKQKDEFLSKNPNYKFTDQEKEMDF